METIILTYGSRGDVQPFLPLSLGLMKRGHTVKLAAPNRFGNLVEEYGIPYMPLAGDPEDLSRRLNNAGYNFVRQMRELMDHAIGIGADVARQTVDACEDADLIVHTFAHLVGGHTLAREKKVPDVHIQTFPMFAPTGDYPNVTMPDMKYRWLNRMTRVLSWQISWWTSKYGYEQVRRRAGLPKRKLYSPFDKDPLRPLTPILCAWSPGVLPPSSDWPPSIRVTGYFFFDSRPVHRPPVELSDFLESGDPRVCVSFGSMVNRNAEKIDGVVQEALRQNGYRGIILSGWGGKNRSPSQDFLYMDAIPHDWLLPLCSMIIHHGGAGTTSAGLRAGIPSIVLPFTADQPFWGGRVHAMGAGPRPILVKSLTVMKLAQAIAEAGGDAIRQRARALRRRIRAEDGVNRAVEPIESHRRDWHGMAIFKVNLSDDY